MRTDVLQFAYSLDLVGQRFYVDPDGSGGSIVSLRAPANHAPQGADHTVTLNENGSYAFAYSDFGFTDPNNSPSNGFNAVKFYALPTRGH